MAVGGGANGAEVAVGWDSLPQARRVTTRTASDAVRTAGVVWSLSLVNSPDSKADIPSVN